MAALSEDASLHEEKIGRYLLGGTLALFAVRLTLLAFRSGPVLVADEIGYLMNARALAGGVPGQLTLAPFYHGGYSLLLSPILRATEDPGLAYRLTLIVNAALAASVLPLLYLLLTRCAGARPRIALAAAGAASLLPSVTVLAGAAMSENALFPLTVVWLISACRLIGAHDGRSAAGWGSAMAATAAAGWCVHGRMIALVFLAGLIIVWLAASRRHGLIPSALAAIVLVGALALVHLLDTFLIARNYGGHVANETDLRLSALLHPGALATVLENVAGQAWYVLVATFALPLLLAQRLVAGGWRPRQPPAIDMIVAALALLLLLISAASFTDDRRPDMLIYGRYLSVALPPVLALTLVRVAAGGGAKVQPHGALTALWSLTAIVLVCRAMAGPMRAANRWNVADLPFVTLQLGPGVLVGAAVVATVGAWLLARVARARSRLTPAVCAALFVPTIVYGIANPLLHAQHAVYPRGWTSPTQLASRLGIQTVGYDLDRASVTGGLYGVQWFLPRTRVKLFRPSRVSPPSRYVLSDTQWAVDHPLSRALPVWRNRASRLVLWRLYGR